MKLVYKGVGLRKIFYEKEKNKVNKFKNILSKVWQNKIMFVILLLSNNKETNCQTDIIKQ